MQEPTSLPLIKSTYNWHLPSPPTAVKRAAKDFLTLCSFSPKYDQRAADKLFSNALKNGHNDVHIGTAFHLAELCGVKVQSEIPHGFGTLGTQDSHSSSASHTHAREEDVSAHEEENLLDSSPLSPLPTFDEHTHWPYPLNRIVSYGTSRAQYDVLLLGTVTVLGASMGRHVRCAYGGKMLSPCRRLSSQHALHQAKACSRWYAYW